MDLPDRKSQAIDLCRACREVPVRASDKNGICHYCTVIGVDPSKLPTEFVLGDDNE